MALLLGCPSTDEPDEPVVLLDDDDDDDDDDSAAADDDDSVAPGPSMLQAWVVDREILGTGPDPLGESHVVASALEEAAAVGPWRIGDGTPLPGLGLHPDRTDLIEDCEELQSDTLDGLPGGFDIGPAVVLSPSTGDPVAILAANDRYELFAGPRLSTATSWTLEDEDAVFTVGFSAPTRPDDVLPGPGTISLLSPRNITWTPAGGRVEILLLRFASLVNENEWEAVRCVADDDGSFIVDPTSLAGPYTGDLVLTMSRASWSPDGADVFVRATAILATP